MSQKVKASRPPKLPKKATSVTKGGDADDVVVVRTIETRTIPGPRRAGVRGGDGATKEMKVQKKLRHGRLEAAKTTTKEKIVHAEEAVEADAVSVNA